MFNEDVLEEFVKAEPGQETPVMDQEHLEKPIQLRITNGKVTITINSTDWAYKMKMAKIFRIRSIPFPSARKSLCGLSISSAHWPPSSNCNSTPPPEFSTKPSLITTTPRTPLTKPWRYKS